MLAQVTISPATLITNTGGSSGFAVSGTGECALLNNVVPTWQDLVGCAVQPDGSIRKTGATFAWDSGARTSQTISAGDGSLIWLANVATFGGKSFAAGLTAQAAVTSYTHIDFCLVVFEGGVVVYEAGVSRGNFRAPRIGGVYEVAIENGQVVYRADGQVIYRSGQALAYPLRGAAAFFNPLDPIGGHLDGSTTYTMVALDAGNSPSGSWAGTLWTKPTQRGRYQIVAQSSNNVFGYAVADLLATFPLNTVWNASTTSLVKRPGLLVPLAEEYRVNEQQFDDQAADYALASVDPVLRWRLEWSPGRNGLTAAEAAILDNFYNQHAASSYPFYFYDYHANVVRDNVRFSRYERDWRNRQRQTRRIELIRRPA